MTIYTKISVPSFGIILVQRDFNKQPSFRPFYVKSPNALLFYALFWPLLIIGKIIYEVTFKIGIRKYRKVSNRGQSSAYRNPSFFTENIEPWSETLGTWCDILERVSLGSLYSKGKTIDLNEWILCYPMDDAENKERINKREWSKLHRGCFLKAYKLKPGISDYKFLKLLEKNTKIVMDTGIYTDWPSTLKVIDDEIMEQEGRFVKAMQLKFTQDVIKDEQTVLEKLKTFRENRAKELDLDVDARFQELEDAEKGLNTALASKADSKTLEKLTEKKRSIQEHLKHHSYIIDPTPIMLSQNSAAALWLQYQQKDVKINFHDSGISPEVMQRIHDFMTPEMRRYAKLISEILFNDPARLAELARIYQSVMSADMKLGDNYFPLIWNTIYVEVEGLLDMGVRPDRIIPRAEDLLAPSTSPLENDLEKIIDIYVDKIEHFKATEHFKAVASNREIFYPFFGSAEEKSLTAFRRSKKRFYIYEALRQKIMEYCGETVMRITDEYFDDFFRRGGVVIFGNILSGEETASYTSSISPLTNKIAQILEWILILCLCPLFILWPIFLPIMLIYQTIHEKYKPKDKGEWTAEEWKTKISIRTSTREKDKKDKSKHR